MNRREARRVNRDTEILNRNAARKIQNLTNDRTDPRPTPDPPKSPFCNSKHTKLFAEAIKEWSLAWEKEEQDEVEEAARLFQSAYEKCKQAAQACGSNEEYQNWLHVISLKIEGNSLFNEGYSWQDRANQSYSQELYDEALKYYNRALEKYTEGLRRSKDQRFQDCVNIVQKHISTTRQAIDYVKVSTKASAQKERAFLKHA